jgi:hypothetical protein
MSHTHSPNFLRRVLIADAVCSGVMGLVLILTASALTNVLALPEALLRETGILLLPFAAFVAWLASRAVVPRVPVWFVIALNALWVFDSVVLLASGWVTPNVLGYAFVIAQAAVVAVLAELEYTGLRRAAVLA